MKIKKCATLAVNRRCGTPFCKKMQRAIYHTTLAQLAAGSRLLDYLLKKIHYI
jgi:hypothetical protein